MDSVFSFINDYRVLATALVITLTLIMAVKIWWEQVGYFLLNVYYRIPSIGKLTRLSKDYTSTNTNVENSNQIWFSSEETLCMDYFNHYQSVDKDGEHFDKCSKYLQRADETGRNNLHFIGWLLIAAIVFVEAMGFSYVLSGFTIPGASENVQQVGAIGIAFLISVLLVAFTHYSGHELHYNGLIKKVRSIWSKQSGDEHEALIHDNRITLENDGDESQPQWRQMLNRLPHNFSVTPKYTVTICTLVLIILVAVGATYVRGKVLEQESAEAHLQGGSSVSSYQDPYADNLPQELVKQADDSTNKAKLAAENAYKSAGWATFIVLAVIFVFIQLLGILIGYKTGFAGRQSSVARKDMGNFKTKREFEHYYLRKKQTISRAAQKNLTDLQQRLSRRISENATDKTVVSLIKSSSHRNFLAYAELQHARERDSNRRDKARQISTLEVSAVASSNTQSESAAPEAPQEMEARIRQEIQTKLQAEKKPETPEEMAVRIEVEERGKLEMENKGV